MDPSFLRRYVALFLIAAGVTGCLSRLIADKGMSDADRVECDALVGAVKNRFELADFRIPPDLDSLIGTKALEGEFPRHDLWPGDEPQSIGCSTEVRGIFLTLYTVVGVFRVTDSKDQETIVALVRDQRRQLVEAKPILVRFFEREVWLIYRNVWGEANGYGRGEERVLRHQVIR
jgi:hypothetical protein